jgi:hypothetical protein
MAVERMETCDDVGELARELGVRPRCLYNVPFLVTSIGMIVMLLWAGSYKMTAPGAEGIVPLVSNSPLI